VLEEAGRPAEWCGAGSVIPLRRISGFTIRHQRMKQGLNGKGQEMSQGICRPELETI